MLRKITRGEGGDFEIMTLHVIVSNIAPVKVTAEGGIVKPSYKLIA